MPDVLQGQFSAWLAAPQTEPFAYQKNSSHYAVLRFQKNADFDYLYCQRSCRSESIERHGTFEYVGVYCKRDGLVYDDQHDRIQSLCQDGLVRESAPQLQYRLKIEVRSAVEVAIGNDSGNLRVTELSCGQKISELEHFKKHGAVTRAREVFLSGDDKNAFVYRCSYFAPSWTEGSLLEYILNPQDYAAREAAAFIDDNQEAILYEFLANSAAEAAYIALAENVRHPVHQVKKIMQAMSTTSAKTVRVTIRKNDVEFTFKTEADELRRDCGSHYWTHHIAAADRREFERLFGRSADYGPEDILRIEYGRAVIYAAENAQ